MEGSLWVLLNFIEILQYIENLQILIDIHIAASHHHSAHLHSVEKLLSTKIFMFILAFLKRYISLLDKMKHICPWLIYRQK